MSTFLDNWLLRRAMSAPRGGAEPLPDIITSVRTYYADTDHLSDNVLSVYKTFVDDSQVDSTVPTKTAYVTFENNTATGQRARSMFTIRGGVSYWVRGTDSTARMEQLSSSWDFKYSAGTKVTVYIFKDP